MLKLPPLSLYIHIPWCVRKCPYCDFNSHAVDPDNNGHPLPEKAYVVNLIRDLNNDENLAQGRKLSSIFLGGGTPSLFSGSAIAAILDEASRLFGFTDDIEITLEANPGSFEQEKFRDYHRAGVNRLSIGIQSFNNQHLQTLGRIHDRAHAMTAAANARNAGFDNFNLDLMHGLPGQSLEQALADLQQALDLKPTHISWYQLTIEPNTAFYNVPPALPAEDILEAIQTRGHALLAAAGYRQYEVSAYAAPGRRSLHNTNYWQFGDYLGIGAGAHGKITMADQRHIVRTRKTRAPQDYLARTDDFMAQTRVLKSDELPLEFLMNALRLNDGVPAHYFKERTGLSFKNIESLWLNLSANGLVEPAGDNLKATAVGLRYLDSVLAEF